MKLKFLDSSIGSIPNYSSCIAHSIELELPQETRSHSGTSIDSPRNGRQRRLRKDVSRRLRAWHFRSVEKNAAVARLQLLDHPLEQPW